MALTEDQELLEHQLRVVQMQVNIEQMQANIDKIRADTVQARANTDKILADIKSDRRKVTISVIATFISGIGVGVGALLAWMHH